MNANYYLDIRILETSDDADLTIEVLRNQIYSILHGVFRQMPNCFALALETSPRLRKKMKDAELKYGRAARANFDILRIFSAQQSDLEAFIDLIKGNWKIRDYTVLHVPIPVPTAKITGWKSYRRFRIPTRKAELNLTSNNGQESLHSRRMKQAKALPYFKVQSQSNGQQFTVSIDIQDTIDAGQGLPDGYGLARKTQAFSLPTFEAI
ncbi:type I-F CRISPR-associated endoribonuclease Cas6/Csy4 [Acinetobacter pullicarnis]|uniref:type I-F CRISPR-associated endoribonuclease Cas6/Csy4 n=1 Tax=Acinetobacter pullicarnis TaxID=2576829 RepID=UPI00111D0E2F|nr:type I-F CRISPR-associated endoribonuclease Cas6/Csy4 [Acinetobacter pullicarnis]